MRSMMAIAFQTQEIPHAKRCVNTLLLLAATPSALDALSFAFGLTHWHRRLDHRGGCQKVRRQLHVGAKGPAQHLIIFSATAIGFEPPDERRGVFGAEIDLLEILEKFEASKQHGFHNLLKGYHMSGVGIRDRI
jgi:hypothetical protein